MASLRTPRLALQLSRATRSTSAISRAFAARSSISIPSLQLYRQTTARLFTSTPRPQTSNDNNNNHNETRETGPPTPDLTNYYTLFPQTLPNGPPPNTPFSIPLRALRAEFLTLQNQAHPDKYATGLPKQRAEALSALLNEAYRTLSDPLHRAQYLLRLQHDIDVTAEDSAAADKQALDPETLMAVMEVQERIEEVAAEPPAEAEGVIEEMKGENRGRVEENVRVLGEAVERGDVEAMRRECVKLRFWYSVGEGLREWEPGVREIRLVH